MEKNKHITTKPHSGCFCSVMMPQDKIVLLCPPAAKQCTFILSIDIFLQLFRKRTQTTSQNTITYAKLLFVYICSVSVLASSFNFCRILHFQRSNQNQPYVRMWNHIVACCRHCAHFLSFDTNSNSNTTCFITCCNIEPSVPAAAQCKCSVERSGNETVT